jgi:hypothetical protein
MSPFRGGERAFRKADALTWLDSGRTFTLTWSKLRGWVGVRAQAWGIEPKRIGSCPLAQA